MRIGSSATATSREYQWPNGTLDRVTEFIGANAGEQDAPQGFLVEFLTPNEVLRPHFHRQNQFQVVVRGEARMGRHELRPLTVHYADAYTPYGPILGGPSVDEPHGLAFFTLRPHRDSGINFMPESKASKEKKGGRAISVHVEPDGALREAGSSKLEPIIAPAPDGMAAYLLRLGPNTQAEGMKTHDGGGQYYLIVRGSVQVGGSELPDRSCAFVAAADPPPTFSTGPEGANVLVLQFPREP